MVAIDTNIIVRFLTRDHKSQYTKAYGLFKKHNVFIPDSVLQETEWVLRYAYKFAPADICDAFRKLLGLGNVHISSPHSIAQAIEWYRGGLDFSDALHLAHSQTCEQLCTFDATFIKDAKGLCKCSVIRP